MSQKRQLCKIPEFIQFQFYPEQQMHSYIQIQNLTNEIISYKIKTNTPTQYLVKPMEGQIYNREKVKVVFKRKKISQQTFDNIQTGQKQNKQKFLFNITCKFKNPIGIQKVQQTTYFMNVKFCYPKKAKEQVSPVKKVKKGKTSQQKKQRNLELANLINAQINKLNELKGKRNSLERQLDELKLFKKQQSMVGSTYQSPKNLSLQNIIFLIVLAFLLGLWL